MSRQSRYLLTRVIVLLTIPVMLWCLGKVIPAGLNGDTHTVVRWFIVFSTAAVLGGISFVLMIFTKVRLDTETVSEAEILARAAADLAREKQAAQTAKDPAASPGQSGPVRQD